MEIEIIKDPYFKNMERMLVKQEYTRPNLLLQLQRLFIKKDYAEPIDRDVWVTIINDFYMKISSDYLFLAGVSHLYPHGEPDFFPMDETDRTIYRYDPEKKEYLFSVKSLAEIKTLVKLYCEDNALNLFGFNKLRMPDKSKLEQYLDFSEKNESEFKSLVEDTDFYINYSDMGDCMVIVYKKDLLENEIKQMVEESLTRKSM